MSRTPATMQRVRPPRHGAPADPSFRGGRVVLPLDGFAIRAVPRRFGASRTDSVPWHERCSPAAVRSVASPSEWLDSAVAHAAHALPDQGPIEVFVHHNTLHAFESDPFHDAVDRAGATLGVEARWPLRRLHELRATGRIDDAAVAEAQRRALLRGATLPTGLAVAGERVLELMLREEPFRFGSEEELQFAVDELGLLDAREATLFAECLRVPLYRAPAPRTARFELPRTLLMRGGAPDSAELVNPVMVRLTSAYLDLGLARRAWPERHRGMLAGTQELVLSGRALAPWQGDLLRDVAEDVAQKRTAADIVRCALEEIGAAPESYEEAVRAVLLQLPGWSGMVARLERVPADRAPGAPPVSLMELLAVRLRYELCAWRHLAKESLHTDRPLSQLAQHVERRRRVLGPRGIRRGAHEGAFPLLRIARSGGLELAELQALDGEAREALVAAAQRLGKTLAPRILHEAYELHYADRFLSALAKGGALRATEGPPSFQVATCIDDREESFRRAIEETDARAETLGTAGFFGLPIAFRGFDELSSAALCPVVQSPALDLEESAEHEGDGEQRIARRGLLGRLEAVLLRGTRSLTWGVILTPIVGLLSALPFVAQVLFPRASSQAGRMARQSILPAPPTRLTTSASGRALTLEERAARVQATLEGMGLRDRFAEIVVMLGHGSSSVNNPHRSAYDCGACGGRHGGPNARYFAALANAPDVREELARRGMHVPDTTWFVGGAHDTATDGIDYYDLRDVPAARRAALEHTRRVLDTARRRSAHERSRRFESAPRVMDIDQALRHVEERTMDLSEARPELGHVTNAACVVGRRTATEGLFLDRRSFLVSYDPTIDDGGRILERTLGAVGPVGAGISLEYLFSTVDNQRLGSGTKLPHNVAGLLGVMEGSESDLRTGLPRQMIEIHEPMRLLLVCETDVDVARAILARNSGIRALVANEWVMLATLDPQSRAIHVWSGGELVPYVPGDHPLPTHASSFEHYVRGPAGTPGRPARGEAIDGFLPFARIAPPPAARATEVV